MTFLKADRIITGDGKTVIENGCVMIDANGKIAETGPGLCPCENDTVIDYTGHTILPGLFDMHCHIANWWSRENKHLYNDYLIALLTAGNLRTALSKGVTTIRDVMCPDGLLETLKYAVKSKFILSPSIYHCNQAIEMTGGHCYDHVGGVMEVDGIDGVRHAVRYQVKAGADFIKVMGNDGYRIDFTGEEMAAIADESHRLGKKCCAHASTEESIENAINTGFDTIEHGTFMTRKQADKMAKNGQVWVPTMAAYFYWAEKTTVVDADKKADADFFGYLLKKRDFFVKSLKAYEDNLKKYADAGVIVAAGTDVGITPVDDEIKLMCKFGFSPLQAIASATSVSAEILRIGDKAGKVMPGYEADLLVVKGNPAVDISAVSSVSEVFKNGVSVFKQPY